MEQALRERKLWGHITGTAVPPPLPRPVSMAIAAVAAAAGVDPVEAAPAVTPEMSNIEFRRCEDFAAAMVKANSVLLSALGNKDVMASMMMVTPKEKWDKLAADYASVSAGHAANARANLGNFRINDGETVVQMVHRFDQVVNECIIQAVPPIEEDKC